MTYFRAWWRAWRDVAADADTVARALVALDEKQQTLEAQQRLISRLRQENNQLTRQCEQLMAVARAALARMEKEEQ